MKFLAMKAALDLRLKGLKQDATAKGVQRRKRDKAKHDRAFAWKAAIAPEPVEPHEKTANGKECVYCPHHGDTKWVLKTNRDGVEHTTGCRVAAAARRNADNNRPTVSTTGALVTSSTSMSSITPPPGITDEHMQHMQHTQALATAFAQEVTGNEDQDEEETF